MVKKVSKKIILLCCTLMVLMIAVSLVIVLTLEDDPFYPIRGSRVEKATEYDSSIVDYEVGMFETYTQFKKSKWGKAEILNHIPLRDNYYTKEYFKHNNLVLIAFNYGYQLKSSHMVDVIEKGNCKEIRVILEVRNGAPKENRTYYCLYETKEKLTYDYTLSIDILNNDSISYTYINEDDEVGLFFQNEMLPVIYCFETKEDVSVFLEEDPILTPANYVWRSLDMIADSSINEKDIWLVRFRRGLFENVGGNCVNGAINIWIMQNNHYEFERSFEDEATELLCFLLDKGTVVDTLNYSKYYEYEDPAPLINQVSYTLVRDDNSSFIKFNVEETHD